MHDPVRARAGLGRAVLLPVPLHEHLERRHRPAGGCARAVIRSAARPAGRTAPARPPWAPGRRIVAARVPGRGEYWNVYALSNPARSTTSSVSAKSSSVSPGNPTMMSVDTAIVRDRRADRARATRGSASRRYERRIAFSTRSEPDCSGKWMCSQTFSLVAIASITSGVKSCGCGDVNRIRRIPSTWLTIRRRSANSGRRDDSGHRDVAPVGVHVLPEQRHLDDAGRREALHLGQDVARSSGSAARPGRTARCRTCRRCRSPARSTPTPGTSSPRAAGSALGNSLRVLAHVHLRARRRSARSSRSSRCGRACVPTTTSTHGALRWITP